jgi:hypothetical protein
VPEKFEVSNYPNPFNPTTNIQYSLPKDGNVTVKIFDITGRNIAEVYSGYRAAGTYTEKFDRSNLSSGIYFLRVENQGISIVRKISLIK